MSTIQYNDLIKIASGMIIRNNEQIGAISLVDDDIFKHALARSFGYLTKYVIQTYFDTCIFEITMSSNNKKALVRFRSIEELSTYLRYNVNNNGSNFTESATMSIYIEKDTDMPRISRIYGKNLIFGAFKGKSSYKNHAGTAYRVSIPGIYTMLRSICTYYRADNSLRDLIIANPADEVMSCFWLPTSSATFDSSIKPGTDMSVQPGRYMISTTGALVPWTSFPGNVALNTNSSGFPSHTALAGISRTYAASICKDANTVEYDDFIDDQHLMSGILVYPIEYDDIANSRKLYAFYLRPLMQDSFYVDYIDTEKYDLYTISSGSHKPRLKKIDLTDSDIHVSENYNSTGPLRLHTLLPAGFKHRSIRSLDQYYMPKIQFVLFDKQTKKFGEPSEASINFMVNKDKKSRVRVIVN